MRQARTLEEEGAIDKAIQMYDAVIRQYPTATYEDEMGRGAYSGDAQDRINVSHCRKARGPDFSTVSRGELAEAIQKAILAENKLRLTYLISCDFRVGQERTENTWHVTPKRIAPVIAGLRPILDWSSQRFEEGGQDRIGVIVAAQGHAVTHSFGLANIRGGWTWTSYMTSDKTILKRMERLTGRRQ